MRAGLEPVRRVAILRGGGIGDFISITPALRALHRAYPDAQLSLITLPKLEPLARRYPGVVRVLPLPEYPGLNDGPGPRADDFFAAMRAERFDLALQLHGGGRHSNPFVRALGARVTAGLRAGDAPELDIWVPYDPTQHETMRYLDVLAALGIPPAGWEPELPVAPGDLESLARVAEGLDQGALAAGRYLGVNVGAGAESRRWPVERWAAVVDALLDEVDLAGAVAIGGPGEERWTRALRAASRHGKRVVDLAGRLDLGALIALLSRLRLLLSNDTGPAHAAVALGTPTVIVFGSGPPLNWAPLGRAWHRPVADWTSPCRWLRDDGCEDRSDVPCLEAVGVEAVVAEARGLLERLERSAALGAGAGLAGQRDGR